MASRWLETSSASTALGSPSSWPDPDSDSDDSGKRSWSGSETSSLSRWVLTLNDSVRANDPDLQPTEALIDVEDPGARDPDVRGAAIDRVNRFAVPESIGTHYPNLPFGHSVFNKDLVPKDVIDRGTATSAYLNPMKRECKPCVLYPSREGCKKGINCRYCHFEHPTVELSHRIRKSMRDNIKCRLAPLCVQDADVEAIHDALQNEAAKHPLAWIRIQAYLRVRHQGGSSYTGPSQDGFTADPGQSQQYQLQYQ